MKRCSMCKTDKELSEFGKQASGPQGRKSRCKLCEALARQNATPATIPAEITSKCCNKCKETKPLDEFHKNKSGKYRVSGRCKLCVSEYGSAHRKGWTPEQRESKLTYMRTWNVSNEGALRRTLRKYNLTPEAHTALVTNANGICYLCKEPADTLFIDHDHECCDRKGSCGECVRKMLCGHCNLGLGHFKDNPELMEAAAQYVRDHRTKGK